MCFRAGLGLALLAAALAGCSRGVPIDEVGLVLASSDVGCLSRASETAVEYSEGRATAADTAEMWNCAGRSLKLFAERTRGANSGVYTPGELRVFLEKYFLVDSRISDALLHEAMVFKRVLLGGRTDLLTTRELARAQALIALWRDQALLLRPHMPLTLASVASRGEAGILAAVQALEAAAAALGESLEATGFSYPFARLEQLLFEMEQFAGRRLLLSRVRERIGLARALKAVLVAPSAERIGGGEWAVLLGTAARWYGVAARWEALSGEGQDLELGVGRERLARIVKDAVLLLQEGAARHPTGVIPFAELDRLIEEAYPEGVSLQGRMLGTRRLQELARPVVRRWLGGRDRGETGRAAEGLGVPALEKLWETFSHWSEGQRFIEAAFASLGDSRPEASFLPSPLLSYSADDFAREGGATGGAIDAAARLRRIIKWSRPLFEGADTRIRLDGSPGERRFSLRGLSRLNWMHEAARVLVRGYSETAAIREVDWGEGAPSVDLREFKRFVHDIRPAAVELRFLDPADGTLASKRFREAELFTFAGDGDGRLTTAEIAQLLALMASAKQASDELHGEILAAGCQSAGMDPYGYRWIEAPCYRRELFAGIARFWGRLPRLAAFYRGLEGERRERFERALEGAARKPGFVEDLMGSTDSEGFGMIPLYVETFFSRYDRDNSGTIDWPEAEAAFPVFRRELGALSCARGHCLDGEEDLRAVFTHLMARGRVPNDNEFLRWRYLPAFRGELGADRLRVAEILAMLGQS